MSENSNASGSSIAFLIPSLRGGGAEKMTERIASSFAKDGKRVDLLVFENNNPQTVVFLGANLVVLGSRRALLSLPALIFYLWTRRPNVLFSAMNHANLLAIAASLVCPFQCRIIVSERTHLSASLKLCSTKKSMILAFLTKTLYRFADAIVAVSHAVADDLRMHWVTDGSKVHTVYNPVVTQEMQTQAIEDTHHKWLIADNVKEIPLIVGAGRLDKQKDWITFLYAVKEISRIQPVRCLILGSGPLYSNLSDLVAHLELTDSVDFVGFVANPYPYFSQSDCFVHSAFLEGMPNVVIEALALGAHVVATSCPGGLAEILADGKLGHLVSAREPKELAAAIMEAIELKCAHDNTFILENFAYTKQISLYHEILTLPYLKQKLGRRP